jgi:hypothetical protein
MSEINYSAVVISAAAGVVAAFVYSGALSTRLAAAGSAAAEDRPPALVPLFELAKHFVLAITVAGIAAAIDLTVWPDVVLLALWVGFPAVLLAGSVVHEKVSWRLAAIHAGDWLVKLLIIAVIVGIWR